MAVSDHPRSRRRVAAALVVTLAAVGIFVLGAFFGVPLRESLTAGPRGSVPDQVLEVISDRYHGQVNRDGLERIGAAAIAASLGDPYTAYLSPEEWTRLRRASAGAYTGIGVRIRQESRALVVSEVFPGSPAAGVGLVAGDRIVAVGGVSVASRGPLNSLHAVLGAPGTSVVLTLVGTDGATRTVRPVRGDVTVPMVEGRIVTGARGIKVGVIDLNRFEQGAGERVSDQARALIATGATAVVLDLRGDPGGLLDEAVAVASVFLAPGTVVVSTTGRMSPERVLRANGDPIAAAVPVVVLVDGASASASEIVAGALKDHGRAVIVGQPTFGKSKVQVTYSTSDGGAVRVTIATYLTPKGIDIGAGGVTPDIRATDSVATDEDEALAIAVSAAQKQGG